MPAPPPAETRFVELMTALFQMDAADALDFGIYRIIRRHNAEVSAFLGELRADANGPTLVGGRLGALLDDAFQAAGHEAAAEDQLRLAGLAAQLGLGPGLTVQARAARLDDAEKIPALADLVAEYRSREAASTGQQTVAQDRAEVLNHLYRFFARHYQDGDFIVARRYGRDGARYLRSTGEDTEFHWATEDMYYIKSGDIFTDFPVRLANGVRLVFSVEPESLAATRAALKPNDKTHYAIADTHRDGPAIRLRLHYLKGAQSERDKDAIVTAAQQAGAGADAATAADLRRWLARFIARNQSDFFIPRHLAETLGADLDLYVKTAVLDIDQLLAGDGAAADLPRRVLKVARIVRAVGGQLIAFLASLTEFQKALWEKRKLVFETRYLITLDRLAHLAPDWLAAHLDAICATQRAEWAALGLGDYADAAACRRAVPGDLLTAARIDYLPLPVDTRHFDAGFKWSLLAAVTAHTPLDAALDGVAIQSDNWQALNTVAERYRGAVKCIYIDPPYNTGGDGFAYKDSYQSASWLTMMEDRLAMCLPTLRPDGVLFSSIDQNEYPRLRTLLEGLFARKNALGTIVWKNVTDNNPTNIAIEHEYVECFAVNREQLESEWKNPYSDVKQLLVDLGHQLVEEYGDTPALRSAYQAWHRKNREFLGPLEGYKFIDKDGIFAGSRSVHNPGKEGYRYDVLHPQTREPCKQPLMGYRFPEETYLKLFDEDRIIFGDDETKLIELKVYVHEYEAKLPSVIEIDGRSGANDLSNLFAEAQKFKNPKSSVLLQVLLPYAARSGDLVLDFFLGSGTTIHALQRLRRKDQLQLRWLGIEAGPSFDELVIPRVKKSAFALEWLKGRPIGGDGPGVFARVQVLEQYDDTLENLDIPTLPGETIADLFDDPAFALRYRLDDTARRLYCDPQRLISPFGWQLRRAVAGGPALPQPVDLVESLPYLLGLSVTRLWREPAGVVLLGEDRRGQSVAIFFRDCADADSAAWVAAQLAAHPAARVYTNDPAALAFPGSDRLEALEAVLARQFAPC